MSEPFLGEVRLVAFTFAPRGWADCNGQLLPIAQNTALFALLGTTYGGNGTTTFALPNLQGRVAIHEGNGLGLSPYVMGEVGGVESVTLLTSQMPAHNHALNASTSDSDSDVATNHLLTSGNTYVTTAANTTMAPTAIGMTGGNQPHENRQPFLVMRYVIALQGIFPSRN